MWRVGIGGLEEVLSVTRLLTVHLQFDALRPISSAPLIRRCASVAILQGATSVGVLLLMASQTPPNAPRCRTNTSSGQAYLPWARRSVATRRTARTPRTSHCTR